MHDLALGSAAAGTAAAHLAAGDFLRTKCPGTKSPDPHAAELVLEAHAVELVLEAHAVKLVLRLHAVVQWQQPELYQTEGVHPTDKMVKYRKTHTQNIFTKNSLNLYYPGTAGTCAVGLLPELGAVW